MAHWPECVFRHVSLTTEEKAEEPGAPLPTGYNEEGRR
jgi:hypothetical protein